MEKTASVLTGKNRDIVRFGIIGVGNMGYQHAKSLLDGKVGGAKLSALCDIDEAKRERAAALDGNIKIYDDYKKVLRDGVCDAVIVAVPHYLHPAICEDALAAGLDVVCEKPAGVYTKQVKEMIDAAEKSGKVFSMMFNQRTNCLYRKMREMIEDGTLGEIKRVNWIITTWYRPQAYFDSSDWRATWKGEGGGVIFNQSVHQIDLLQWVLGMTPKKLHSFCHFGKWHDIEVEDDVTVYMEFPNGATGMFVTSTGDAPGTNRLEILGNNGKLVCEGGKLTFIKLATPEREFCVTWQGGFGEPKKETIEVETDGKNPQHTGILSNFTNVILGKESELIAPARDGLASVEIMDAILLSTWLDKDIELPIDDGLYLSELDKRRYPEA